MHGHLNVKLIIFLFFKLQTIDIQFSTNFTLLFTHQMQCNRFFLYLFKRMKALYLRLRGRFYSFFTCYYIQGSDKSLARPGRKQANVSVKMA